MSHRHSGYALKIHLQAAARKLGFQLDADAAAPQHLLRQRLRQPQAAPDEATRKTGGGGVPGAKSNPAFGLKLEPLQQARSQPEQETRVR
jgi:hypothetical protein